MQTPMQRFFDHQPPGAPGRPAHLAHKGHPSMAQLAAVGIHPPNGVPMSSVPMTPVGQGQFPHMMGGGPGFGQQNALRNRRSASISIGGPPKAVLGGPARKLSPMPPTAASAPAPGQVLQGKKVTVNLPKETVPGEDGQPATRPEWARTPLQSIVVTTKRDLRPPELTSSEAYPPDSWRLSVPNTLDVFLPGKVRTFRLPTVIPFCSLLVFCTNVIP
jgi:hypothetical protein